MDTLKNDYCTLTIGVSDSQFMTTKVLKIIVTENRMKQIMPNHNTTYLHDAPENIHRNVVVSSKSLIKYQ